MLAGACDLSDFTRLGPGAGGWVPTRCFALRTSVLGCARSSDVSTDSLVYFVWYPSVWVAGYPGF